MLIDRKNLPSTHRKFVQQFSDDQSCAAFLEKLRWPDGFCCPVCQTTGALGVNHVEDWFVPHAAIRHQ